MTTIFYWISNISGLITIGMWIHSIIKNFYNKKCAQTLFYLDVSEKVFELNEYNNSKLSIKYNDFPVTSLTKTTIYFWASQHCEILKKDYQRNKPPMVYINSDNKNDVILDCSVISLCDPDFSKAKLFHKNDKEVLINFERISFNNGFAVSLTHTADNQNIIFKANLIDKVKCIQKYVYSFKTIATTVVYLTMSIILSLVFAIILGFQISQGNYEGIFMNIGFAVLNVILLIFCIFVIKNKSRIDLPKNIKKRLSLFLC